jgi:type IV secretory pathway VirB10-like protein
MEAVCPQCSMRYEVGEELLQQGTPVMCPACQVPLNLVQPGTNVLIQQPLEGESPAQPEQTETAPQPPPEEPPVEEPPVEEPPAEAPLAEEPSAGPGQSWDSGELLWGGQTGGSDDEA